MRRGVFKVLIASTSIGFMAMTLSAVAEEGSLAKPTTDEIRHIESKVRMPRRAGSKRHYARYYYVAWQSEKRIIKAIYVQKEFIDTAKLPTGDIAIVTSDSEIPVPQDAECGVVFVEYFPESKSRVSASCSAGFSKVGAMPPNTSLERTRER